ncbi:wsc domain-containing protein [Stemphylium lycopersici]|uniref:Wsc domain-containing protein n=1 Tax=Stemphylium lycopersici TaxID=183478 RepID=A0A364NFP9_STELY|nr:wsc domain-containing protein [Stemphylium lycopersici]RAR04057.1 wsc domain-containing protein [Stemphylium lycopersici]RAR16090.1 wsc domain-containing protein [Stemphylium lycopersici]
MKSVASLSAAAAFLSGSANAFWRMPCHDRTTLARLDPIVDKGTASSHSHAIHGGSNFAETTTYDMLRESECTSCQFDDDKSAYWTPSLHFIHENGEVEVVPQVGGMLAYYLLLGDDIKAFPKGFQMLAGDSRLRNFTGPVPDPPTSAWTADDKTQLALGQKSLGFNCLNYNKAPEGSRYRHFLPDKDYMDANCANGIRAEIFFPSCWNGKDVAAPDHKSHVAYPSMIDGGECPKGYETRLPSLFYETIWNTYKFKGVAGQFTWSNGDPTGYGYHADFINGWNIDTLQSAVDQCTNPSGRVEDCPIFSSALQSESEQGQCKIKELPKMLEHDDCEGLAEGLCGNVPVQYGPEYAAPLEGGDKEDEEPVKPTMSSKAPVPTQSYAPARSEGAGGISVYNVEPSSTYSADAYAAAITPPADIADAPKDDDDEFVTTSTYTKDGIVYEVAIKEVVITTTVGSSYGSSYGRRHAQKHRRQQREHVPLARN